MTNIIVGMLIGLIIGIGCRWFEVPLPAPPTLVGAFLVVAMSVGYLVADRALAQSGQGNAVNALNGSDVALTGETKSIPTSTAAEAAYIQKRSQIEEK